jgi:hypothetical protein
LYDLEDCRESPPKNATERKTKVRFNMSFRHWTHCNHRYLSSINSYINDIYSKKAVKEKQSKAIDDVTFGLKNKNKSKKVQQFISRVEKAVKYNPDAVNNHHLSLSIPQYLISINLFRCLSMNYKSIIII